MRVFVACGTSRSNPNGHSGCRKLIVDYNVAGEEHFFAAGTDMHRHVAWRVTGGVEGARNIQTSTSIAPRRGRRGSIGSRLGFPSFKANR